MRTIDHPRFGTVEVLDESPLFLQINHPQHDYMLWFPKADLDAEPAPAKAPKAKKALSPEAQAKKDLRAKAKAVKIAAYTPAEAEAALLAADVRRRKAAATREANMTPAQRERRQKKIEKKAAAAARRAARKIRKAFVAYNECGHGIRSGMCEACRPKFEEFTAG